MATFEPTSRYADQVAVTGVDAYGQEINVVPFRRSNRFRPVARHRRSQGQRLDHVAAGLLGDPHGFWRLCETNDAMSPDALTDRTSLDLPGRSR